MPLTLAVAGSADRVAIALLHPQFCLARALGFEHAKVGHSSMGSGLRVVAGCNRPDENVHNRTTQSKVPAPDPTTD